MFSSSNLIVLIGTILLSLNLSCQAKPSTPNCNCVVFRLDDIQDFWIADAQKAVIEVFKEDSVPVSIGIISNKFGADDNVVQYVKDNLGYAKQTGWKLEISNHGFNHENFADYSRYEQKQLLSDSFSKTVSQLKPYITHINTFIPPYNSFNDDTISVLEELGIEAISSQVSLDQGPIEYSSDSDSVYRWPINAATSDMNNNEYIVGISAAQSFSQIKSQINEMGFASVMMHPQEFAIQTDDHQPTNDVDEYMIEVLRDLLKMCRDEGIEVVTFEDLRYKFE